MAERGIDSKREGRSRFDPCGAPAAVQIASQFVEPRALINPLFQTDIKKYPARGSFFMSGGERGIRTLDTFPYTHFPGVLLRPLGHLT